MNQDDPDLNHLAESWIADWELRGLDNEWAETSDSVDKVSDFHLDDEHDALWRFILATYRKPMSPRVFAILAAGPLEDLLANFGPEYIDRIETLARQDPKFKELLGGVWKNAMTDEVWERVGRVRGATW